MALGHIIITGGFGSIGRALVKKFIAEGYKVISIDKSAPSASDTEAEIFLRFDLAEIVESAVVADRLLGEIHDILSESSLIALINNAAVQKLAPVASLTRDQWKETLDVNLSAAFFLTQLLLPSLKQSAGSVVNIGSVHARLTKPAFAAYATSKAALAGLTRAMAVDLAGLVAVNCIEPAAVNTTMLREGFKGHEKGLSALAACHPLGRIGAPSEVSELAYMLAINPGFLNGAIVSLDGGISGRLHDPL